MEDNKILYDAVNAEILNSSNQAQLAPGWVANGAYQSLDPDALSPLPVRYAATLHLKQIARSILRGKFNAVEVTPDIQHNLFPDLQMRYPVAHSTDAEPIYLKLELLSDADVEWNIARLRKEAATKFKHARALEAWAIERGMLHEIAA